MTNRTAGENANEASVTAFSGTERIARGTRTEVARAVAAILADPTRPMALVFDDATGGIVDLPPPGQDIPPPRGPGRPKLGVTAREVTLLPHHWTWLQRQPGGASVALRRIVDAAINTPTPETRQRAARERTYRFLSSIAGDLPGFEEATRRLFAGDEAGFCTAIAEWPPDVTAYATGLLKTGTPS